MLLALFYMVAEKGHREKNIQIKKKKSNREKNVQIEKKIFKSKKKFKLSKKYSNRGKKIQIEKKIFKSRKINSNLEKNIQIKEPRGVFYKS